jgi:signal transduction histidine kinase
MSQLTLQLVEEKDTVLNHFTYAKVFGFTLLLLAIPVFFILPFLKGKSSNWFFVYFDCLMSLGLISFVIMSVKYYFKYDYINIGSVNLDKDQIRIERSDLIEQMEFQEIALTLNYNSIRGKGFHFLRKDFARSGISEIVIDNQRFKVLVSNEEQMNHLKKLLLYWYQNNYSISEFMRTPEQNRLKELELIK